MVTECSPLNQLQSIKIDLKIHTRGPKTDNYSPNVGRSVTLFDLCVLFLMALDNEWLIIIIKLDPRKNIATKNTPDTTISIKTLNKVYKLAAGCSLVTLFAECRWQMCTLHAINFIVARGRFSFAIIGSSFGGESSKLQSSGDIT